MTVSRRFIFYGICATSATAALTEKAQANTGLVQFSGMFPNIKLIDSNGASCQFSEIPGSHDRVINFFSIRCPPCVVELPALNALVPYLRKAGMSFMPVVVPFLGDKYQTADEMSAVAAKFMNQQGLSNLATIYRIASLDDITVLSRVINGHGLLPVTLVTSGLNIVGRGLGEGSWDVNFAIEEIKRLRS